MQEKKNWKCKLLTGVLILIVLVGANQQYAFAVLLSTSQPVKKSKAVGKSGSSALVKNASSSEVTTIIVNDDASGSASSNSAAVSVVLS